MNTLKRIFKAEYIILASLTVILIISAFYLFSLRVKSTGTEDDKAWNEYYAPMERSYVETARAYLEEKGFRNAGVTLTHTTDGERMRTYTLTVHHGRLSGDESGRSEEIASELESLGFSDERCNILVYIS